MYVRYIWASSPQIISILELMTLGLVCPAKELETYETQLRPSPDKDESNHVYSGFFFSTFSERPNKYLSENLS